VGCVRGRPGRPVVPVTSQPVTSPPTPTLITSTFHYSLVLLSGPSEAQRVGRIQ